MKMTQPMSKISSANATATQSLKNEILTMRNVTLKWEELMTRYLPDEMVEFQNTAASNFMNAWKGVQAEKQIYYTSPCYFQPGKVFELDSNLNCVEMQWGYTMNSMWDLMTKVALKRASIAHLSELLADEAKLETAHVLDLLVLKCYTSWKVVKTFTAHDIMKEWQDLQVLLSHSVEMMQIIMNAWNKMNNQQ